MYEPAESDTSDVQIASATEVVVKKGRGRPPKSAGSAKKEKNPKEKRGRGRPIKKKNVGKPRVEKEKTVGENGVKKRGRPVKKEGESTPKETNLNESVKRGRGRPKKN